MPNYNFQETIAFYEQMLKASPPKEDVESGEVELVIDNLHLVLAKSQPEGALKMEVELGMIVHPLNEEKLHELVISNFLGVNTGGCTLAFNKESNILFLKAMTSPFTPPQENWEWMHRIITVAKEWQNILSKWEEFIQY